VNVLIPLKFAYCPIWTWPKYLEILGLKIGGESLRVGEHPAVVIFEFEAYPEPKALSKAELKGLMTIWRSTVKVAKHIGASQAFVWLKLKED
jgi:hypothetical protein